jgi:hypothetical protein
MSHAHGWATGPASALSQRVLGLRPLGAADADDDATTAATDDDDAAGGVGGGPQQVLVSKRIVCATKSDHFTQPGSGQIYGKHSKKGLLSWVTTRYAIIMICLLMSSLLLSAAGRLRG